MSIQEATPHSAPEMISAKPSLTRPSSSISGVVRFGIILIVTIFGGIGIWSAVAPLACRTGTGGSCGEGRVEGCSASGGRHC